MSTIEENEKILLKRTLDGLNCINGVITYGDNKNISDRLGIVVFNIDGMYNAEVARLLANPIFFNSFIALTNAIAPKKLGLPASSFSG